MKTGHSDIAQVRAEIVAEQQAASLGVHGLSQGTSRHACSEQKTEQVGPCFAHFCETVGSKQAREMVVETVQQVPANPSQKEAQTS